MSTSGRVAPVGRSGSKVRRGPMEPAPEEKLIAGTADLRIAEVHPRSDRSMGELLRDIGSDTSTLIRKEMELAKQEITRALVSRAIAAGAGAAAAVLGLFVMGFLGLAAAAALDNVFRPWASRLIVAGGFLLLMAGA